MRGISLGWGAASTTRSFRPHRSNHSRATWLALEGFLAGRQTALMQPQPQHVHPPALLSTIAGARTDCPLAKRYQLSEKRV